MATITVLSAYRAQARKKWLQRYRVLFEQHIHEFLIRSVAISFTELRMSYQRHCSNNLLEQTWSYEDLRDIVYEHLDQELAEDLYRDLLKQRWFDRTLISRETILEHCVNLYCAEA